MDELFDIGGRGILVAGGAGGLGAALAGALAARGARVMVADMDGDRARVLAETLGGPGEAAASTMLDVTDPQSCQAAVEATVERFGRLDGLLNASGVYHVDDSVALSEADWRLTIDVNLTGAFNLAQAAGRVMLTQGGGRILTIASVSSAVANPRYAAYAASKAGVAHLTRVLAVEWAARGVMVNAIGPAVTPTPLSQPILDDRSARDAALARIPAGRFGTTEDLIGATVFFLSAASCFVTGQTLYVDGGRTVS